MSTAARARLYRERLRCGRMVVTLELDGAVTEMLTESGLLAERDIDDRSAVGRAIERLLELLVESEAVRRHA
jgi:hypothetical protein